VKGLTVRWPLGEAPAQVADELRAYVAESSHARFTGMAGLEFKTWRMRPGEWFEGCYAFSSDAARAEFQESFTQGADTSPVSEIVGRGPESIQECEIVAVAEGWERFTARSAD